MASWLNVDIPLAPQDVIEFASDWKLRELADIYYYSGTALLGKMDLFHKDGVFFCFRKRKITFASALTNLILYKLPNMDRVSYIRSVDDASINTWFKCSTKLGICKDIQGLIAKWIRSEPFIIDEFTNCESYQEFYR